MWASDIINALAYTTTPLFMIRHFLYNKKALLFTTTLWFVCMVFYIKCNKYDALVSDPGAYIMFAQACAEHCALYPDASQLYSSYIFNPGWVNFIVLWISIFGSVRYLAYVNAVFNICIVCVLWLLCRSLFNNKNIAYTTAYMYMILPSFFTISNHTFSELYFILMSTTALYFASRNGRWAYLAGLFTAIAMWTRPIALGWIIACLFLFLWQRLDWKSTARYIVAYVTVCATIAICTHRNYPDYAYKATTGGVNLIMGANNHATGYYCAETFNPVDGLGYIENPKQYTVKEKDSIWTHRAVKWIAEHPKTYALLTVKKLFNLYNGAPSFTYSYKHLPEDVRLSGLDATQTVANPFDETLIWANNVFLRYHFFFFLLIMSIIGFMQKAWRNNKLMLLYLPLFVCTTMTIATVGELRYSMVMLPLIIITAAYSLHQNKARFFRFCKMMSE